VDVRLNSIRGGMRLVSPRKIALGEKICRQRAEPRKAICTGTMGNHAGAHGVKKRTFGGEGRASVEKIYRGEAAGDVSNASGHQEGRMVRGRARKVWEKE